MKSTEKSKTSDKFIILPTGMKLKIGFDSVPITNAHTKRPSQKEIMRIFRKAAREGWFEEPVLS